MYCAANLAVRSRDSYVDSWKRFVHWCESIGRPALPATGETAALWATSMLHDGLRITTVETRLSGVAFKHKDAGMESPLGPETRHVLNGARRLRHENPNQKRALTPEQIWKICRTSEPHSLKGARERAVILIGFAGAFRRSELADLDLADVLFVPKGVLIHLKWTKTDQEGRGRDVPIFRGQRSDTCPVRALLAWIERRGAEPGPLFLRIEHHDSLTQTRLKGDGIAYVVKRAVERIGLDPHQYAGHSLRSGCVTTSFENGANEASIMKVTGHKSVEMLYRYFRPNAAFARNPLAGKL